MADSYDITIEQGATFSLPITWRDSAGALINLSGYTARLKVKDGGGVTVISLTEADGIALGGALGTITLSRSAALTTAYTFTRGVYDLELVSGAGVVTRLLKGQVIVTPEVTV